MIGLDVELGALRRRFEQRKEQILSDMAQVVVEHTNEAFKTEGYTRSAFQRWKEKKRRDGLKILHQTGELSSSTFVAFKSWPTFIVKNDTEYADFHNYEAATPHVPERHFLDRGPGESPALDKKLDAVMNRHMDFVLNG